MTYEPSQPVRQPQPTFTKALIFLALMVLITAALIIGALTMRSSAGPKVPSAAPPALSVQVAPVQSAKAQGLEETYTGLAEARRTSQLGFSSGGRIQTIRVDIGDKVAAGAGLAVLDTRALQAQLKASEALITEARAALDLAMSTVERQRTLQTQGHVSAQRVDEAEAQANSARARIDAASAAADTLRVQIDLARITAPFSGVVTGRFYDEGAIAGPGQAIIALVETGHLEARIGVPAAAAAQLKPGTVYQLKSDSGDVAATLRTLSGVIDSRERTMTAAFTIDTASKVPVGATLRLQLARDIQEEGFWVPVKAMTTASRGLWTIYVARKTGDGFVAERQPVDLIYSDGDRAFVRGALKPGDQMIVDGLHRVTPGVAVMPVDAVAGKGASAQ